MGHLVPGANINWVDGLDRKTTPRQNATPAQLETEETEEVDYAENLGGPGRTRTYNQQIMSSTRTGNQ